MVACLRWHNYYLLIPFAPLIAILCLVVWVYEYLKLFNEERVENNYTLSKAFTAVETVFMAILTFPLLLLGPFRSIITLPLTILFLTPLVMCRVLFWDPIFENIVPNAYLYWNSRLYEELDRPSQEIRTLEILPGNSFDAMRVKISIIDLSVELDNPSFDALSYSWGGHYMLRRVIRANEQVFFVSATVFNALKALRHPQEIRRIWIDFMCIDQSNELELRAQLNLMGNIYGKADTVFVWLGDSSIHTEQAFNFIRQVAEIAEEHVHGLRVETDGQLKAIQKLLLHRWWSRVWVVPEVTRGNQVIVKSGQFQLSWEVFSEFLLRCHRTPNYQVPSRLIDFVDAVSQMKRPDYTDPPRGLLDLALRFRQRVASQPRDKVFALLGLLKSPEQ